MADKTIICKDCNEEFTFTAGEQEFYASKGYDAPVRCPECRRAKKQNGGYNTKSSGKYKN